MMTETPISSRSSAVESARLEAVTPTPLSRPDGPAELEAAQREVIVRMVR